MTSLAKQLQKLAVPHTQTVLSLDKRRTSLLFDPKEAANLDRETIFALGLSGLEELETIDDAFIEYEASLFNQSSVTWERTMHTREVNTQLDHTIDGFLVRLSPYLMLRSAHKTLEWLIYRYHIHQLNIDTLLLCAMPYHDTKIFVRLIQLVKLSNPTDKWHWLEAAAKSGVPLARGTLVNHCQSNPGFMSVLCDLLPKFIKVHGVESQQLRPAIAMVTCTLLGSIQHRNDIKEKMVAVLVPHLVSGLRSKCLEYMASSYMILSQLCSQTLLKENILESLVPVITKKLKPSLLAEGLQCLAILYQTQKITDLPKKSFKHLCRSAGLVQLLIQMTNKFKVGKLFEAFVMRLIPAVMKHSDITNYYSSTEGSDDFGEQGTPQYSAILLSILQDVSMHTKRAELVTRLIVDGLLGLRQTLDSESGVSSWTTLSKNLLRVLENRYCALLDETIKNTYNCHSDDETILKYLQEMTSLSLLPMKYKQFRMEDRGVMMCLGLHHADVTTRVLSVKQLMETAVCPEFVADDFVIEALLSRLLDDERVVVEEILVVSEKLLDIIPMDKLSPVLLEVLEKRYNESELWEGCLVTVTELLCDIVAQQHNRSLLLQMFPFLVVTKTTVRKLQIVQRILREIGGFDVQMIVQSGKLIQRGESFNKMLPLLAKYLTKTANVTAFDMIDAYVSSVRTNQVKSVFLCLSVLRLMARNLTDGNRPLKLHVVDHMVKLLSNTEIPITRLDMFNYKQIVSLKTEVLLECIHKTGCVSTHFLMILIITASNALAQLEIQEEWCSVDKQHHRLLVEVLSLMMERSGLDSPETPTWNEIIASWVNNDLPLKSLFGLCSLVWTSNHGSVLPSLQVGCSRIVLEKFVNNPSNVTAFLEEYPCLLPSVLVTLLSDHQPLREAILNCLNELKKSAKNHRFGPLIRKLMKRKEEILTDPLHVIQVLGSFHHTLTDEKKVILGEIVSWINKEATPSNVTERLLTLLQQVPYQHILNNILPCGRRSVAALVNAGSLEVTHSILDHILSYYHGDSAKDASGDSESLTFLVECLQCVGDADSWLCLRALKQITKEFFHNLPSLDTQQRLLSAILDTIAAHKDSSKVVSKATSVLRRLKLNGCHVERELKVTEEGENTGAGRKKLKRAEKPINYPRLTFVLEVLGNRKKVKDSVTMATMLFSVLRRLLLECGEETEYCVQLVLTALHNTSSLWNQQTKPQNQDAVDIELLVQCIRGSVNSHTQKQALMVMSVLATLFPEHILHHVMSVFTFMGTSLLQQDDSQSFQVTVRTLETLIPAIIQAKGEKDGDPSRQLVTQILQVFVDARHHIPKHRRSTLFHKVLELVSVDTYGWVLCVQVVESSVRAKDVPMLDDGQDIADKKSVVDRDLEFVCELCEDVDVTTRVYATTCILTFLRKLTSLNAPTKVDSSGIPGHPRVPSQQQRARLYPLHNHSLTAQQLRLLQFNTTKLVVLLLAKQQFVSQILSELESDNQQFKSQFQQLIKECLSYVTTVAKVFASHSGTATAKFWKALLAKVYEVLDKVNYVLPSDAFLELMGSMVGHSDMSIRRKALELLSTKLQHVDVAVLTDIQVDHLLKLVDTLLTILGTPPGPHENEADSIIIKQFAFFGLKVMCKLLGGDHPKTFTKVFPQAVALLSSELTPPPLLGNCLLCIAELCTSLKAHAVPYLNKFMPPLLDVLARVDLLKSNEAVLVCSLMAVQRVLTSLAHFISPYLSRVLLLLAKISSFVEIDKEMTKKPQPAAKLRIVCHHLATDVPPRVLVPAISSTYATSLESGGAASQASLACLLSVVKEHVEQMSKDVLTDHQAALRDFFSKALDLRNENVQLNRDEVLAVENLAIDALLGMVVKLSEASFRPLYYRLYDWACREESNIYKNRRITFFRLSERLSSRLKSLFNMFVAHSVKMCGQLLEQNNSYKGQGNFFGNGEEASEKSCELLEYIMGMIYNCLLHDTDGFLPKEVFSTLLQPLVNQIENFVGGEDHYSCRISQQVAACVSQLAVTFREDSSWKSLNYQVCLKTRHDSAKVRFASLQVLQAVAEKLGDEYVTLLPEAVPFLAELLEDESEEVEQQCQHVVTCLEQVLGESLQSYF